ncbi:MAG: hypothetical protein KAT90_15090 [Gammaproteobacteria bacterium]|nr:hypothetical protein [Gammaproteobacteria bacterium]
MGLEVTTTIDGLDETWPLGGDQLGKQDDHTRLLKAVLKNIFAGSTGNGFSIPITASEAELNLLDGVTASTAEINALDITAAGTAEALKALVLDSSKNIAGLNSLSSAFLFGILTGDVLGNLTGNVTGDVLGDVVGNVTGDVTGNADTVTTNADLTGEVTSSGNATTVVKALQNGYQSAETAITSGDNTSFAHALGSIAKLVTVELVCQTAEYGYSVGDVLVNPVQHGGSANKGFSCIIPNSTNVEVTIGAATEPFDAIDHSNGTWIALSKANWKYRVKVWI